MAEPIVNTLGIVGMKHCGAYDGSTNYEKLNVVTYQGSSYCAKGNTVGNLPTNTTYWDLLAEKGSQGDEGPQGPKPVKGVDYYTAEDVAEMEASLDSDVTAEVSEQLSDLVSATPLAASSIADMIDTTRIYVLTTDGHWYWYDGDSWEDGGVYQATESIVDEYLDDESTNPIQNKTITNAISNVIDITTDTSADIEDIVVPTLTAGFIQANGTFSSSTTYYYTQKIPVKEGDSVQCLSNKYTEAHGIYGQMRFICAYDSTETAIEAKGSNSAIYEYTVPAGIAYVVVSAEVPSNKLVLINYTGTVQDTKAKYREIKNISTTITNYEITKTDGMMDENGYVTTNNNYEYTSAVSVSKGDIVVPLCNNSSNIGARTAITSVNDNFINQYGHSDSYSKIYKYVVPNDYVNKVRFSLLKSANISSIVVIHKESVSMIDNKLGGYSYRGDIGVGETVSFDTINLKPSYNINFSAHVTTLDKIEIGLLNGDTFTELFGVDGTNLETYSGDSITTGAHGLTIANDLAINVRVEPYNMNGYDIAVASIFSNGQEYTTRGNRNIYTYNYKITGKLAVRVNNSVVDTCSFSVGMENIDKPIWIFGDSWISNYSQRWVHWLYANDNAKNCFFNGYPGENSANGLIALKNALKIKTPKYLLWLYGMNDNDTTAVNSSWLSCLNEVIELCKENSIELILCTIPSSSVQLNQKKNDIVRNSGYRYFDQAGALEFNGTWLPAYRADTAHPTTEGAKALYYKLLTDVPEITNYR